LVSVETEPADSWEWPEEDSLKSNGKEVAWLQECCISLSSTGELLVIAHKNVMVVLTCESNILRVQHFGPFCEINEVGFKIILVFLNIQ
jgi:hypothetical protein